MKVRRSPLVPALTDGACWPLKKYALVVCLLTSASQLFGAFDGVVLNSTTGQPVAGVTVSLIHPGENGMQTLGSAKSDEKGAFKIDADRPSPPALLQADFQGVTYTQVIPPNMPTSGVTFEVYESTSKPSSDLLPLHLLMLDSVGDTIEATETFYLQNKGKTSFQDPANGSVQFYPPKGAPDKLQVTVIPPTQMPIQRTAEKAKEPGRFKIDYPVRPGETEFDIHYSLPASAGLSGKVVKTDPPMRLLVPLSVKISGDGISEQGTPPNVNGRLYSFTGTSFNLKLEGTGSIRIPQENAQDEDTGAPQTKEIQARIYDKLGWVLGLTLGILALGGALLYRRGTA
jgi:hypothetical protein